VFVQLALSSIASLTGISDSSPRRLWINVHKHDKHRVDCACAAAWVLLNLRACMPVYILIPIPHHAVY
jgi:hypothetical protein